MPNIQGEVVSVNRKRAAAQTKHGHTVFDIYSGQVSCGDILSGPLDYYGGHTLRNLTTDAQLSVYVEETQADSKAVQELLWGQ